MPLGRKWSLIGRVWGNTSYMDEREKGSVVDDDDGSDAIRDVHDDKSVWTNSIRFWRSG